MSKALNIEMPGLSALDPSKQDPFSVEIRRTVEEIIDGRYVLENMSPEEKADLRQRLLGVTIALKPDGEIIHE